MSDPEAWRMLNATGSGKCLACGAPAGVHSGPCQQARETALSGIRIVENPAIPDDEVRIITRDGLTRFKFQEATDV